MAPLLPRSNEKGSNSPFSNSHRARDFGILFACLIGLVLSLWLLSRILGRIDLVRRPGRQPRHGIAHEHERERDRRRYRDQHQHQQQQQQYMNPARFMQLCARRDEQMKKKEKVLLTSTEIDIMAPITAHRPSGGPGTLINIAPVPDNRRASSSSSSSQSSTSSTSSIGEKKTATTTTTTLILVEPEPTIQPHRASRPSPADEDEASCCVCLEGFSGKEVLRATRCAHVFHGPCLEKWLMRYHSRCPLCQTNLKPGVSQSESES